MDIKQCYKKEKVFYDYICFSDKEEDYEWLPTYDPDFKIICSFIPEGTQEKQFLSYDYKTWKQIKRVAPNVHFEYIEYAICRKNDKDDPSLGQTFYGYIYLGSYLVKYAYKSCNVYSKEDFNKIYTIEEKERR